MSIISRARPEILAMKGYSSARSLHKKQAGTVFLDANECSFEPFIGASKLSRYPDQQPADLQDAICRLYDVAARNLAMMRGADEAIDVLMRAFCVPGQDNVIICPPSFAMYEHSAMLQGAEVKRAPLGADFALDAAGVLGAVNNDTKLIFLCSPNNPSGNIMDTSAIETICAGVSETALVVVDETYIEFSAGTPSMIAAVERIPNLVILRTLSKSYAAAGLRCGFAIARADVIELLLKVLPPYPLAEPVIQTALEILKPANTARLAVKRQDIVARKKAVIKALNDLDDVLDIYPSDANFILLRVRDADRFVNTCLDGQIIVRNQSHQEGLENCVRISMGSADEMDQLISVLQGNYSAPVLLERRANVNRNTNETAISVAVNLDRAGPIAIDTGVGFYDHMLEQIAKHGGFSLQMECAGDLEIDPHHTIEDCSIALGQALKEALGDKRGIGRYGFTLPMDEALAQVAMDLSGRFYLDFNAPFPESMAGDLPTDMVEHVFRSLAENLQANLHIRAEGDNTHHIVEACFKGFGRALRQAIRREGDDLPSTKGAL